MINLKNLDKWLVALAGEAIVFDTNKARQVRVEINAPFAMRLYLHPRGAEDPIFLAVVEGLEVVQFWALGAFDLIADGDFSIYSTELEDVSVQIADQTTFTRIAERRQRNPELEYMMAKMGENLERRLSAQQADFQRTIAAVAAERQLQNANNSGTPVAGAAPVGPEPVTGAVQPASGAGEAEPPAEVAKPA